MANRKRPHFLGVWIAPAAKQLIDSEAERRGLTRSEVVRAMLAYAARHMPKGWTP